ncbi:bpX6 domain-containing protein [Kitasatospora sp. NBC_01560]|uniref:bpX6 domain-containing protein n=1 Tax=Kitasatospora sp. NBC_01560 TaxID=2975965 RepID=UPI003868599F
MTATPAAAFRATLAAAGFLLDVPVIGATEAAGRVLAHWQEGAELRELPDGRWLLVLAEPVGIRADRAPGLPLRRVGNGALVAVGTAPDDGTVPSDGTAPDGGSPAAPGHLVHPAGGRTLTHRIADLTPLDPADWLDPTGLTVHRPRPLGAADAAAAEPVREALPPRPRPDLRTAAGIGPRSERARRLTADTPEGAHPADGTARRRVLGRWRSARAAVAGPAAYGTALAVLVVAALAAVVGLLRLIEDRGLHPAGLLGAIAVGLLAARRRVRGATGGGAPGAHAPGADGPATPPAGGGKPRGARRHALLADLVARLTMRSPAGRLVAGRHARYLRELTRAFEQRRWEDALRDAVRLAGDAPGTHRPWLSLGLPRRYAGELRPTPGADGPAGTSPLSGPTVHQHLGDLYRRAAESLEREGRIDEAAFVLADLLGAPAEAVALLDRHGRTARAAELAEGRELAADLVVRLWWRAGERERAVRTAHRRGAFAAAVERLGVDHPEAARELRLAWAQHCREAGDRLGAVEAVWPDEALRPTVAADLRDAVALGGPARGRALPFLLALGAGEATRGLALAVLDGDGDPEHTGRAALAAALADLPAADRAADRELATAAARAAVRDGGFGGHHGARSDGALFDRLKRRADPLAAADLPRPRRRSHPAAAPPAHTAAARPGTLPVLDAALLGSGSVLVACGQAGVRLLAPDGRTRARWDVPADRLVVADHGGSALLVAGYGRVREVARLDLATRTVRPWATLPATQFAGSYDGRHLITADQDGIAVLDTLARRPTVVWRELGGGQRPVGRIARTAGSCAAVVVSPLPDGSALTELWRWDQPGWQLRSRLPLDAADTDPAASAALATGGLLTAAVRELPGAEAQRVTALRRTTESTDRDDRGDELTVEGAAPSGPVADGDAWALAVRLPGGSGLLVHTGSGPAAAPAATVAFPHADGVSVGLRRHADALTLWHRSGRVVATSADGATLLANLRVTVD